MGYRLNTCECTFFLAILYRYMLHYHHLLFIHPFFYSLVLFKNVIKCHAATNLNGI